MIPHDPKFTQRLMVVGYRQPQRLDFRRKLLMVAEFEPADGDVRRQFKAQSRLVARLQPVDRLPELQRGRLLGSRGGGGLIDVFASHPTRK